MGLQMQPSLIRTVRGRHVTVSGIEMEPCVMSLSGIATIAAA